LSTPEPDPTTWTIEPAGPLRGDVSVRGSKNAVTKHMVGAVLGQAPSTILNCPEIGEVETVGRILRALGCEVETEGDRVTVDAAALSTNRVPLSYGGLNRIPILLVGPLLHRTGEAFVPLVGGDRIGARPVDFHVQALEAMGAEVTHTVDGLEAKASR
jgi:UDP-N-acetylglucosamine 1-carboxyvinyltransferase